MPAVETQIIGGEFQDAQGTLLENGYLLFQLSQDASVADVGYVASGITIKVPLDSNADVLGTGSPYTLSAVSLAGTVATYTGTITGGANNALAGQSLVIAGFTNSGNNGTYVVLTSGLTSFTVTNASAVNESHAATATGGTYALWGNDNLLPVNTFYKVRGYTAEGQLAFGPNSQQIVGSSPFDLGTWIPNEVISWQPPLQSVLLQSKGVNNGDQSKLNLHSSDASVVITDDGTGDVNLQASSGGGPRPSKGTWHYTAGCFNILSAAGASIGMAMTGGNTVTGATAIEPSYTTTTTTASTNQFKVMVDTVYQATLGILADWQVKAKIAVTTNCRYWVCMTDDNSIGGGQLEATLPACAVVGFRYVAGVDTDWQCYCSPSGGATQTIVSSGVAPSTTVGHVFEVQPASNGTVVKFFIDGVQVGSINTNLPTTTTLLSLATHVDNVPGGGSAATPLSVAFFYWESNS